MNVLISSTVLLKKKNKRKIIFLIDSYFYKMFNRRVLKSVFIFFRSKAGYCSATGP